MPFFTILRTPPPHPTSPPPPPLVRLGAAYDQLVAGGVKGLHYVRSKDLYARAALYGDGADVTMGGVHPGDVGTRATAEFWIGHLPSILSPENRLPPRRHTEG